MTLMQRRMALMMGYSPYQRVEWIDFTGTQYIDTGYNDEFTIEIDFLNYLNTSSGQQDTYFGCQNSGSPWNSSALRRQHELFRTMVFVAFSGQPRLEPFSTYNGTRVTAVASCYANYQSLAINNNTLIASATTGGAKNGHNLFIGAMNNGGSVDTASYAKMRLYRATIYTDRAKTQVVRDFVPCINIDTGAVGLLDLAHNVFYQNAGSGTFTYG